MEMPKLSSLPTQLKEKSPFSRIWHWQNFIHQWKLLEDWEYQLPNNKPLFILPKGFIFDGVSLPRPLYWFLSPTGILLFQEWYMTLHIDMIVFGP